MNDGEFQDIVHTYYDQHKRVLPWRDDPSLYKVLVSEFMLQQTQVERAVPKFQEFMQKFPNIERLATASLGEVLAAWQGLGYNRRAKFLHETAKEIVQKGHFPTTAAELTTLPGVGKNTAGAILAYAYNQPVVYVETNIRTVYFHHYFQDRTDVSDAEVLTVVERTLDRKHPREWFWALMDYGTYLKSQGYGRNMVSKHYTKQAAFRGSVRELRGAIIRELSKQGLDLDILRQTIPDERLAAVLEKLVQEGLVVQNGNRYALPV